MGERKWKPEEDFILIPGRIRVFLNEKETLLNNYWHLSDYRFSEWLWFIQGDIWLNCSLIFSQSEVINKKRRINLMGVIIENYSIFCDTFLFHSRCVLTHHIYGSSISRAGFVRRVYLSDKWFNRNTDECYIFMEQQISLKFRMNRIKFS